MLIASIERCPVFGGEVKSFDATATKRVMGESHVVKVRVHKIVGAIDPGIAVNPDQVKAQMKGGAIHALTSVVYGEITIERGRVKQSNFHDYKMLRIDEVPEIEVHILDSGEAPGGLGEPDVPTVAPAVCNAIFALTDKRFRSLPIRLDTLKRA